MPFTDDDGADALEMVKRATCRVSLPASEAGSASNGTGYLVRADRVVTCEHVVNPRLGGTPRFDSAVGQTIELRFHDGTECKGTVINADAKGDCALIEIEGRWNESVHLRFAAGPVTRGSSFISFGYPAALTSGVPLDGQVTDCNAGGGRIMLRSPELAAPHAPVEGLSGSPVVVGGLLVGHVQATVTIPGPLVRPVYGQVYATSASTIRALLDFVPQVGTPRPATSSDLVVAARLSPAQLHQKWSNLGRDDSRFESATHYVVERLLSFGSAQWRDRALAMLEGLADSPRTRQLRALALARSGQEAKARGILEALRAEGALDAETLGILGGIYKRRFIRSGDPAWLGGAFELYQQAFEASGNPYAGINAAALALWDQRHNGTQRPLPELVQQVLGELDRKPREDHDHWDLATLAEAALILGDLEGAATWYHKASAKHPDGFQDRAVMRRQARLDLAALGRSSRELDPVFAIPGVAAFTGHMIDRPGRLQPRLPPKSVHGVRSQLHAVLARHKIGIGFAQAADGGDTLFLEALLERDGRAHVVLPFPSQYYETTSVLPSWRERFARILAADHVEVEVLADKMPPTPAQQAGAFRACNEHLFERACEQARALDEVPILICLWNGAAGERGGTADAVRAWRERGFPVVEIELGQLDECT